MMVTVATDENGDTKLSSYLGNIHFSSYMTINDGKNPLIGKNISIETLLINI